MSNFPKVSSPVRQGWIQTQAAGSRGPHFSTLYHIVSLEGGDLETPPSREGAWELLALPVFIPHLGSSRVQE